MCFGPFKPSPAPPIVMQQPASPPQAPSSSSANLPRHNTTNTTEYITQEIESPAQVVHPAGTVDPLTPEGGKRTQAMQKKAKKKGLGQFRIDLDEAAKSALTAPKLYPTSGLNIPV